MITFSHILNTENTGDYASGPYHYFDFLEHEVINYADKPNPDSKAIIYGGGTLTGWVSAQIAPECPRIAWGIGSTRHGETAPLPAPKGFALLGIRDWPTDGWDWVPCASCMSPLFDKEYEITRDAVAFINADDSIRRRYPWSWGSLPVMDNTAPMQDIVAFLGSAMNVVTDSYHAAYWATLLGRRVACVGYSSKFYNFRHQPYCLLQGEQWRDTNYKAFYYPEALEECREANRAFYKRVMEVVS